MSVVYSVGFTAEDKVILTVGHVETVFNTTSALETFVALIGAALDAVHDNERYDRDESIPTDTIPDDTDDKGEF